MDNRPGSEMEVELSDSLLLDALRQGDAEAFNALFRRYHDGVFGVAFRLMGKSDEAEDLTQEAFVRLFRRPPVNGRSHNLAAWLYRVALNLGYNTLRSERRRDERERRVGYEGSMEEPDPAWVAMRREEREHVRHVLARLKPEYQAALVLRHGGLSYAEIAATLDITIASVGTVLARAEKQFKAGYLELKDGQGDI